MKWRHVRLAEVPPVPWRNGGGTTRELLVWPDAQDWRVRISVAEVASDGPFSSFPGVERWFAVLEGAGVRLDVDGVIHEMRKGSPPLRFDGGAPTHATLIDGPTLDLNLMFRGSGALLSSSFPREERTRTWESRVVGVYDMASATLAWQIVDSAFEFERSESAFYLEAPL